MANENEAVAKALVMSELKRKGQIGYTEPGKVLFNLKLTDRGGGFFVGEASESTPTPTFEVGKTYTVKTDNGTITVKAKWYEEGGAPYLGDIGLLFGNADTGEGFVVADMPNDDGYLLTVMDANKGTSCTVSTADTTVPIKPEYLPGVCLPVVEIANQPAITAEESAKLTACIGMPIVVKISGSGTHTAFIMSYQNMGSHAFFTAVGGEEVVIIASEDGVTWAFGAI